MSYRNLHVALLVLLIVLDLCMLNVSGVTAFWLRCRTAMFETGTLQGILKAPSVQVPLRPYELLLFLWNICAFAGLGYHGSYRITKSLSILDEFLIVLKGITWATVCLIVILFIYRGYQEITYFGFEFSRIVVILSWGTSVVLLTLSRLLIGLVQVAFIRRGIGIKKAIVVGAGPEGIRIVNRLQSYAWLAYRPVGFLDDDSTLHGTEIAGLRVLGGTNLVSEVAEKEGADEVIVALPPHSRERVEDIVGRCHRLGLRFKIMPDLFEILSGHVKVGAINGVPVLDVDDVYLGKWDRFLKRGMDLTGALFLLFVLSPVWVVIAALIKLSSRGPVLFLQVRVGEHGKQFCCYKLRTMQVGDDSEDRKRRYADLIKGSAPAGKIVSENRITRIGKFLRKSSLDELPQLLNVMKGEMSLVGPRPPIPYEVEFYDTWHMERFKVKPGITGLPQVSGRADLPFEEIVRLDLFYLRNWSLWLDVKILLKTIPTVLSGRGA